ncbi:hypothetical protein JIN85_09355 [Luteolibacter pohnpeiensis]|uniref:Uncharacterized protein n=1 Tax=Luteolibacter pohnpeiensis TaxID=454153 RepID=A0A934VUK2_9BACT|nr:hypothetical protein [Luteolibacter pohnpeiensis]MBK1882622.1 hypothetical protein [Luteolibacter pohnpeiensis]
MSNPYATPNSFDSGQDPISQPHQKFGGIGRLTFFGFMLGIAITGSYLIKRGEFFGNPWFWLFAGILPAYLRLKNIGMNPKLSFLLLAPIANCLIIFRCLIAQEGYIHTQKLDRVGKMNIVLAILGGATVAILLANSY